MELEKRQEAALKYFGKAKLLDWKDTFRASFLRDAGLILDSAMFGVKCNVAHGVDYDIVVYNDTNLLYLGNGAWDVEKREAKS